LKLASGKGFFLADHTFEIDLFRCGRHNSMTRTLYELTDNKAMKERAKKWKNSPGDLDPVQFLKDLRVIKKGRFAQRLATRITGNLCPAYIKKAIEYVASRCQ